VSWNGAPIRIYRWVFAASFLNVPIGLWALVDPVWFADVMGGQASIVWAFWGAMLLAVHWLYGPGLLDPVGQRWVNWSSIVIKLSMACLWTSLGLWRFAAWDATWGLTLLAAYSWVLLVAAPEWRRIAAAELIVSRVTRRWHGSLPLG
jgi:hypothetical protein